MRSGPTSTTIWRAGLGAALILTLATAPGLAAAQSRPDSPPRGGGGSGSDVDTARALIGAAGWLAQKARENAAKKKAEEERKRREQEEAARKAAEEAAAAPPVIATPETATRTPPPPPDTARPYARTPQPAARPPAPVKAAERPAPTPKAEPVVAPAPPPVAAASIPPPVTVPPPTKPVPPPASLPPWEALGLGLAVLLAILAAAAWAARRAMGWGAAPPVVYANVGIDPGDPSAPEFPFALSGPLVSLEISRGGFVSEAYYPQPAG